MDEDYLRLLLDWLRADPELPVQRDTLDDAWAACTRVPEVTIPAPRVPERG